MLPEQHPGYAPSDIPTTMPMPPMPSGEKLEAEVVKWRPEIQEHLQTGEEKQLVYYLRHLCSEYMTSESLASLDKGLAIMLKGHFGQTREIDSGPFSRHCLVPAILAAQLRADCDTLNIILNHDVVEDSRKQEDLAKRITLDEIQTQLGNTVAEGVSLLNKVIRSRAQREETLEHETTFKIVEATTKNIRAAFAKVLEQWDNARTLSVKPPKVIREKATRMRNFIAPLASALGLPDIAHDLVNFATQAEYPEESARIIRALEEKNLLDGKREETISNILLSIPRIPGLAATDGGFHIHRPTLYDLLTTTQNGAIVEQSTIPYKVDICYIRGNLERALSYLHALRANFIPTSQYNLEQLYETGRLEFTLQVDGGPVQFRLIPDDEFALQRVSMLPLVQVPDSYTEEEYQAATMKHARWQQALAAKRLGQRHRFTSTEFIRFLEGEQSIKVTSPKGTVYELTPGATVYDYICRLHLPKLLKRTHATITRGNTTISVPLSTPLEDGDEIYIPPEGRNKSTSTDGKLNIVILDQVVTIGGKDGVRKILKKQAEEELEAMRSQLGLDRDGNLSSAETADAIGIKELQEQKDKLLTESASTLLDAYRRGKNTLIKMLTPRLGLIVGDVPLESALSSVRYRYKSSFLQDDVQRLLFEVGLELIPPHVLRAVIDGFEALVRNMDIIEIDAADRAGLDTDTSGVLSGKGVSFVTKVSERPWERGRNRVKFRIYISGVDNKTEEAILNNLQKVGGVILAKRIAL